MLEKIRALKEKYGINICNEYSDFILKTEMFDYTGNTIRVQDTDYEINHFLKASDCSSEDLFTWYLLLEPPYKEYLTIAFCIYDEEIAIKVKGDELGKVVLIVKSDDDESTRKVYDVSPTFSEFLKMIK